MMFAKAVGIGVFVLAISVPGWATSQVKGSKKSDLSRAEAGVVKFPELLPFHELIRLSPEKRQDYLDGVAFLLDEAATISQSKNQKTISENVEDLRGRFFVLQALISPAVARNAKRFGPAPEKTLPHLAVPRQEGTGLIYQAWTCDSLYADGWYSVFDRDVGTCVASGRTDTKCPADYHSARYNNGRAVTSFCIPNPSWELLHSERKAELERSTGGKSVAAKFRNVFRDMSGLSGREVALGGKAPPAEQKNPRMASGQIRRPNPPAAPADPPLVLDETLRRLAGSPAADATAVACDMGRFACSEPWDERKRAYYADPDIQICVFSGNAQPFLGDGRKRDMSCTPKTEFSFGDGSTPLRCDLGTTMCNPLVFSVQEGSGAPFCVPAKEDATRQCRNVTKSQPRQKDFLAKKINGMKEQWEEFRGSFNKLCRDNVASFKFHCEECGIMAQELLELNAYATNTRCGDLKVATALSAPGTAPSAPSTPAAAPASIPKTGADRQ